MPVEIHDSKLYQDKSGGLGKALLSQDHLTEIYRASHTTKSTRANINIVNNLSVPIAVTIWISGSKEPSDIDLYESAITLLPNAAYYRSNVILSANEALFAKSNGDGGVIRIEGYEDNPR